MNAILDGLQRKLISYAANNARHDGFMSAVTNIGTNRDKSFSYSFLPNPELSHDSLDLLYAHGEFCYKIIDMLPDAGMAKSIDINHKKSDLIMDALNNLNKGTLFPGIEWLVTQLDKMSRLHGGAGIFWDIDDGLPLDQPVNPAKVKKLWGGTVVHAGFLFPQNIMEGIRSQLWWVYHWNGQPPVLVHVSRLSIDHSCSASEQQLIANNMWPIPIMTRIWKPMQDLITSYMKIPTILEDFITGTYSVEGLNEMLEMEDDQQWKRKMEAQADLRSIINEWVQDAKDKYEKQTTNLAHLPETIEVLERRFTAVADTPYGKIFGEYGGNALSNSGDSQNRDWNKSVASHQKHHQRPPIARAIELLQYELRVRGAIKFDFPPLDEPTNQEVAQLHQTQAQADASDIQNGVLLPEEVAQSRYGGGVYSLQTQLDPALRAKKQAEKEKMQAQAPPPQFGQTTEKMPTDKKMPMEADQEETENA